MGINYSVGGINISTVSLDFEEASNLIIQRARQLVNKLIEDRGHNKPPFLPEEFVRLQGIKKIVKSDLGDVGAILLRFHDGCVIKVNRNHHPVRQNFSCAHEIGHALFSELELGHYIRSIECRTFNPQARDKAREKAKERLCDAAAIELLMPEAVFKKYLTGFGVSINSVEWLANIFKVSIQAAAIRIAEVSEEPCIALFWQPWPKNKFKGLRLAWRVGPGRKSRGKDKYMPLHTYVRPPSTLHKAYQDSSFVKSSRLFKCDNAVKRLPMESKGFGRGETRYVVSLAFLNR